MSATAARATDRKPPPPIPCNTRAPINCGIFCDSAHSTEAPMNNVIAIDRIGRRPYRSLSLP
jgi:hypothetical protein